MKLASKIASYPSDSSKNLVKAPLKQFMAADWSDTQFLTSHSICDSDVIKFLMKQEESILQSYVQKVMAREDGLTVAYMILDNNAVKTSFTKDSFLRLAQFFMEKSSNIPQKCSVLLNMVKTMNQNPGNSGSIIQVVLFAFTVFKDESVAR